MFYISKTKITGTSVNTNYLFKTNIPMFLFYYRVVHMTKEFYRLLSSNIS